MWLAAGLSFTAGALAVISPCTLPVLPGIVGALTDGMREGLTYRSIAKIILFALGAAAALIGSIAVLLVAGVYVNLFAPPVSIVIGALFIALALSAVGVIRIPTSFPHLSTSLGWLHPPVLGFFLALIWVPCVGPSLGMALSLGSNASTVGHGIILALCYFLGLAVPIFAFGVFAVRFSRGKRWAAAAGRVLQYITAGALALIGLLLISGVWDRFSAWIVSITPSFLSTF